MADGISMLLIIVGVVVVLYALFKGGKSKTLAGFIGVIIVVVGLAGAGGYINYGGLGKQQTYVAPPPSQPQQSLVIASGTGCSANAITSNGKSQADVVARNVENASLAYLAGSVSANSAGDLVSAGGSLIDSATTTAGSTPSYVSMSSVPNCGKGLLVGTVTTGAGFASSRQLRDVETGNAVAGYDFTDKAVHKYELQTASADVLSCDASNFANTISSSWLTNASTGSEVGQTNGHIYVSGTGTADGNFYFSNTSLGVRGTLNFYIHCQVNGTGTVFGAYNEPDSVSVSYNPGSLSRFSVNSLVLASNTPGWSLTKGDCSTGIAYNRNARACWTAPNMKAGTLYEIKGTITADLGDVVVGDTMPQIFLDDKQFFRDTGTNIKYGAYSTSGTNQGVGGTIMNFVFN